MLSLLPSGRSTTARAPDPVCRTSVTLAPSRRSTRSSACTLARSTSSMTGWPTCWPRSGACSGRRTVSWKISVNRVTSRPSRVETKTASCAWSTGSGAAARTVSASPHRRRWLIVLALVVLARGRSVSTVARGSMTMLATPRPASSIAADSPVGPPPTISTGVLVVVGSALLMVVLQVVERGWSVCGDEVDLVGLLGAGQRSPAGQEGHHRGADQRGSGERQGADRDTCPGGHEQRAVTGPGDGADPADAERPAQAGGPGVGGVEPGDVVVEHVLRAEAAEAGDRDQQHQHPGSRVRAQQRERDRGGDESGEHQVLRADPLGHGGGQQGADDRPDVVDEQEGERRTDGVSGRAHDLRQPGAHAEGDQQAAQVDRPE